MRTTRLLSFGSLRGSLFAVRLHLLARWGRRLCIPKIDIDVRYPGTRSVSPFHYVLKAMSSTGCLAFPKANVLGLRFQMRERPCRLFLNGAFAMASSPTPAHAFPKHSGTGLSVIFSGYQIGRSMAGVSRRLSGRSWNRSPRCDWNLRFGQPGCVRGKACLWRIRRTYFFYAWELVDRCVRTQEDRCKFRRSHRQIKIASTGYPFYSGNRWL